MKVTECKYCDSDYPPRDFDGDLVCSNCGAEWADAKSERELTKKEIEEREYWANAIFSEYDF